MNPNKKITSKVDFTGYEKNYEGYSFKTLNNLTFIIIEL